jgi:hypothetical protein
MAAKNRQEYEKDFYAWTIHNAKLLREGKFSEVDVEHVAEEIERCLPASRYYYGERNSARRKSLSKNLSF